MLTTRRVGESSTLQLAKFSIKHWKADSSTRRVGESSTPPTHQLGESFFDYEYLREIEAKNGMPRRGLEGIDEEPISAKTPGKIHLIAMSL